MYFLYEVYDIYPASFKDLKTVHSSCKRNRRKQYIVTKMKTLKNSKLLLQVKVGNSSSKTNIQKITKNVFIILSYNLPLA